MTVLLAAASPSAAQMEERSDTLDERVFLKVETNARQAILYADSTFLGRVSDRIVAVPAETRLIRLVLQDLESWSISPVEHSLRAQARDTVTVRLPFRHHYRIESMPFGAHVHLERDGERIRLGATPLLHRSDAPLDGVLAVERPGYVIERIKPGDEIWNRHLVSLSPSQDPEVTVASVDWKPPRRHRQWIDYAALGTAVAAGAIAIHYKFKADALYAEYEDSADHSLRTDIHAYDVRSGVAFGVMQAGIGVFAVRLFLR